MPTVYDPEVTVFETTAAAEEYVANGIIDQVQAKPESVLTLPTGGTPIGVYGLLVAAYQAGRVDFSRVTTLNLDEYYPIDTDHPTSYKHYMDTYFFSQVNVPPHNRNIPDGMAPDRDAEAERYEKVIQSHAIDLGLIALGPGRTCHIAFNERGSALDSRTRYVVPDQETMEANARYFDSPEQMPTGAITQGVANILAAQRILFIVTGEHKAWGVRRSLQGEISTDAPASFLRYHPAVSVVLDQGAASLL